MMGEIIIHGDAVGFAAQLQATAGVDKAAQRVRGIRRQHADIRRRVLPRGQLRDGGGPQAHHPCGRRKPTLAFAATGSTASRVTGRSLLPCAR